MKNRILLALVIGQGFLIVGLLIYKASKQKPSTGDDSPEVVVTSEDAPGVAAPSKDAPETQDTDAAEEPTLEDAVQVARDGLKHLEANLKDYRGRLLKRERINGELTEPSEMEVKIQERRTEGDTVAAPMRVYLKFVQPSSLSGREVIWEEGQRDGKLVVHESGLLNVAQVWLDPTSKLAMGDNLYPISEIGLANLVRQLIARGENDFKGVKVKVSFTEGEEVDGHTCEKIRIEQLERREDLDFQIAEIFIDCQRKLPLRYAAYAWPDEPGGVPPLLEEYTYLDVETNVGLTDDDFDPDSENYNFPSIKMSL